MDSMKFKGLLNKGENSCFINVIVQLLWTVKEARNYIMSNTHTHLNQISCLTCEISNLFTQMAYSEISNFSTTNLRNALTTLLPSSSEFQELEMGCAVEAFEQILQVLHSESIQNTETSCQNMCITHKFFGFQILEERFLINRSCCKKFEISEIQSDFLLRIYSRDLEKAYQVLSKPGKFVDFNEILGYSMSFAPNLRKCEDCLKEIQPVKRWVTTPKVWGISIIWDPSRLSFANVLLRCLNEFLYSKAIFFAEDGQEINEKFIFRGIVCFQYSHYCGFFYEVEENAWYQVDDNVIKKITRFENILRMMHDNQSLPVLLLYEVFTTQLENVYQEPAKKKTEMYSDRDCFNCKLL